MPQLPADFIAHRVDALAFVAFTRRPDLQASRTSNDGEIDLLVKIRRTSTNQERYLGVILKGTAKSLDSDEASKALKLYFNHRKRNSSSILYPFPVLAAIFSMENDEGYVAWRMAPAVAEGRQPRLQLQESFEAKRFTKAVLDTTVDQVNSWYDAAFETFTSTTPAQSF